MIISKDTNPEKDLYCWGAIVIEALAKFEAESVDFITLLQTLKCNSDISSNLFVLSLDWLYLLGTIELTREGNIKKCF